MADRIPDRAAYEGTGGWKDGRFGQAYDLIAEALKERGVEIRRHPILTLIEQEDDNFDPDSDPECPASHDGRHHVDTSMESGPYNCFHCERSMK
ncbi:MAG: hypothetical protein AB1431_07180 [Pseudomonadota bacterium]